MRKATAILLISGLLSSLLMTLTGCAGDDPFQKGARAEKMIRPDQPVIVGDATRTGWTLYILPHTFDEKTPVSLEVLSTEQAATFKRSAFEWIGTPVKLSAGDNDSVRLNEPVTVTMLIPAAQRVTEENADDCVVGYYTDDGWEYLFPDFVALNLGAITFQACHLSLFGAVRLTAAEKINLYARKMALLTWEDEQLGQTLSDKLQALFNESFKNMGITDASVRRRLTDALDWESNFGALTGMARQNDISGFATKCGEMASQALIQYLSLEGQGIDNLTEGGTTSVNTGLSKGIAALARGNDRDAAAEMAKAFINCFPADRACQAALEVAQATPGSWKDPEMDAAYKAYVGTAKRGQYGYAVSPNDWTALEQQMRGYLARLQNEAKDQYCQLHGLSRSHLDQDAALSQKISETVSSLLKRQFEQRRAAEQEIAAREATYGKIIEGFARNGLLERRAFAFTETDVQDRLRTLFALRKNILNFSGPIPVLSTSETAEDNLDQTIAMWLSCGPEKRGTFYQWLIARGYDEPGSQGS